MRVDFRARKCSIRTSTRACLQTTETTCTSQSFGLVSGLSRSYHRISYHFPLTHRSILTSGSRFIMEDQSTTKPDLADLATLATNLSAELNGLQLTCGHESTATDIQAVSKELILLADEISSLDQALNANGDQYTSAFYQDLAEIVTHLHGIFDDVFDCAKAMRKTDSPGVNAVGWLHKKRYVHKLQKHLAANKTTLTVMRTVIRHGKDYGTHT